MDDPSTAEHTEQITFLPLWFPAAADGASLSYRGCRSDRREASDWSFDVEYFRKETMEE